MANLAAVHAFRQESLFAQRFPVPGVVHGSPLESTWIVLCLGGTLETRGGGRSRSPKVHAATESTSSDGPGDLKLDSCVGCLRCFDPLSRGPPWRTASFHTSEWR